MARAETIHECRIPKEPFADLLVAFRQDQTVTRFETMDNVLAYCRYSANPVGRLVLYICGYTDAERFALSDATCSALQLANFWQDVRVDLEKDRVYLPQADMRRFNVNEKVLLTQHASDEFRALLKYEVEYTRELFAKGLPLIQKVDRDLALDLDLFSRGGLEILNAIEKRNFDVLSARPVISKSSKLMLAFRAVAGKFIPGIRLGVKAAA